MTTESVFEMLKETGLPVAYYQFDDDPANPAPPLPFVCYYYQGSDDLVADGYNYVKIRPLTVELYTKDKDFDLENRVEAVFARYELPFLRTEAYVKSERMYQITYSLEVLLNES